MIHSKIRMRFLVPLVSLLMVLTASYSLMFYRHEKGSLEQVLERKEQLLQDKMREKASVMTSNLVLVIERALAQLDFSYIQTVVEKASNELTELDHLSVSNSEGRILFSSDAGLLSSELPWSNETNQDVKLIIHKRDGVDVLESRRIIRSGGTVWGAVILSLRLDSFHREIENSRADAEIKLSEVLRFSIFMGLIFGVVGVSVVIWTVGYVTAPLLSLTGIVRDVREENLDRVAIPECSRTDEVGILSRAFQEMISRIQSHVHQLRNLNASLEIKVQERTHELHEKAADLEKAHQRIIEGLSYAMHIQHTILPERVSLQNFPEDGFIIWKPMDLVGGDFYWFESFEHGHVVVLADCTGHGVPGALMSMTAYCNLRRIIHRDNAHNPAEILNAMNLSMRQALHKDREGSGSDDGVDLAVAFISSDRRQLIYAGARLDLYLARRDEIMTLEGERMSIGFRRSNPDYRFSNQRIDLRPGDWLYWISDGYFEQMGGAMGFPFGKKRLMELIRNVHGLDGIRQEEGFLATHHDYKGDGAQNDDVSLMGFQV